MTTHNITDTGLSIRTTVPVPAGYRCNGTAIECQNPATDIWWYSPANMVVFVCGVCDPDAVGDLWSEIM